MLFLFLIAAFAVAGLAASEWLWFWSVHTGPKAELPGPMERLASAGIMALALLVSWNWVLARSGMLETWSLLLGAGLYFALGAGALFFLRDRAGAVGLSCPFRQTLAMLRSAPDAAPIALVPLVLWLVVAAAVGWYLPPINVDALAYHLTKAAVIVQEGGHHFLQLPDFRATYFPANFELLLADVLILTGSDQLSEWISLGMYLLFALLAGALAERWWGPGWHVLAAVLVAAGLPVTLLHSVTQKNDLMHSSLVLAACLWAGRWAGQGGRAPVALVVLSALMALGTKLQAGFLIITLVPLLIYAAVRHLRRGVRWGATDLASTVMLGVFAFFFLGGFAYIDNVVHTGSIKGVSFVRDTDPNWHGYGAFKHIWMFPLLLLLAPLSSNHMSVWAPWTEEPWYWPHWNPYFSHFGGLFTLLVLALPLSVLYFRKEFPWPLHAAEGREAAPGDGQEPTSDIESSDRAAAPSDELESASARENSDEEPVPEQAQSALFPERQDLAHSPESFRAAHGTERLVASLAALGAAVLTMPIELFPRTGIAYFPRFVVYLVPVVAAWTVVPAVWKMARGWGDIHRATPVALLFLLAAIGSLHGYKVLETGLPGVFTATVEGLRTGHSPRRIAESDDESNLRATVVVDQLAGPNDVIAVDVDADAWTYLAFGEGATRKLHYLRPGDDLSQLSEEVDWIVVDRSWNVNWGNLDFESFADVETYFGQGWPRGVDGLTIGAARKSDDFAEVYFNEELNQAVFHRKSKQSEFFQVRNKEGAERGGLEGAEAGEELDAGTAVEDGDVAADPDGAGSKAPQGDTHAVIDGAAESDAGVEVEPKVDPEVVSDELGGAWGDADVGTEADIEGDVEADIGDVASDNVAGAKVDAEVDVEVAETSGESERSEQEGSAFAGEE